MQLDDENSFHILNELNLSVDSNNDLQSPTIDFWKCYYVFAS